MTMVRGYSINQAHGEWSSFAERSLRVELLLYQKLRFTSQSVVIYYYSMPQSRTGRQPALVFTGEAYLQSAHLLTQP